jgi:hypothetical protein
MSGSALGLPALMKAHGSFGYTSGGMFMIGGVLVARYCRFWPYWFMAHVVLELFGFCLTLTAFILTEVWHRGFLTMQDLHAWNGFAFLCLFYGQLWLGWLRPGPAIRWRPRWRWTHAGVGALLVADFIVQAYSGIHRLFRMFNIPNERFFIIWSLALGVFGASIVMLEPTKWPPRRFVSNFWRVASKRYAYRGRVLLGTISALSVLAVLFLVFLSISQSTTPWVNDNSMGGMSSMLMRTTFFWYDPKGFHLWFSNFVVIGVGRLVAAGLVVGILAFTASLVLHSSMQRQQLGPDRQQQTASSYQKWLPWSWAFIYMFELMLHYFLMLAVMTYSAPLLFFILIGHGVGALLAVFRREAQVKLTNDTQEAVAAPESPKKLEDTADLRVLLNTSCCAGSHCCGSSCTCKPGACFCGIEVREELDKCCRVHLDE